MVIDNLTGTFMLRPLRLISHESTSLALMAKDMFLSQTETLSQSLGIEGNAILQQNAGYRVTETWAKT